MLVSFHRAGPRANEVVTRPRHGPDGVGAGAGCSVRLSCSVDVAAARGDEKNHPEGFRGGLSCECEDKADGLSESWDLWA